MGIPNCPFFPSSSALHYLLISTTVLRTQFSGDAWGGGRVVWQSVTIITHLTIKIFLTSETLEMIIALSLDFSLNKKQSRISPCLYSLGSPHEVRYTFQVKTYLHSPNAENLTDCPQLHCYIHVLYCTHSLILRHYWPVFCTSLTPNPRIAHK